MDYTREDLGLSGSTPVVSGLGVDPGILGVRGSGSVLCRSPRCPHHPFPVSLRYVSGTLQDPTPVVPDSETSRE